VSQKFTPTRKQIDRAEKVAEALAERAQLKRRRRDTVVAVAEAQRFERPKLGNPKPPKKEPEFTDEQLAIAVRSLERQGKL